VRKAPFEIGGVLRGFRAIAQQPSVDSVEINLPGLTIPVRAGSTEKRNALRLLIKLRDKRVLTEKECCDSCIRNALASISEIRQFLTEEQLRIADSESPTFLLADFMLALIRGFLTLTEPLDPVRDMKEFFSYLNDLRTEMLHAVDQTAVIAGQTASWGFRVDMPQDWKDNLYLRDGQTIRVSKRGADGR